MQFFHYGFVVHHPLVISGYVWSRSDPLTSPHPSCTLPTPPRPSAPPAVGALPALFIRYPSSHSFVPILVVSGLIFVLIVVGPGYVALTPVRHSPMHYNVHHHSRMPAVSLFGNTVSISGPITSLRCASSRY